MAMMITFEKAREEAEAVRLQNMLLAHSWRLELSGDLTLDNNTD